MGKELKLSVIVPSIRPEGILNLYNSIDYNGDWELIAIGPICPMSADRFEFIKSFRSPNSAQQQGLLKADGDYICMAADDGIFLPGALDKAIKLIEILELFGVIDKELERILEEIPKDKNYIVVGKYLEGDTPHPDMMKKDYYKFGYHKSYRLKGVPQDNLIFNCGIISRKFMLELGGWDCSFEATTCAHADLGIRASQASANMILMDKPLFKCSHQPGNTGDHRPIHNAMKRDLKTFEKLYSKPRQTRIELDNWKNTPEVWSERFGK